MPKRGEIDWTDEMELAFLNLMHNKFLVLHHTNFKRVHWMDMRNELVKQFPHLEHDLIVDKLSTKHQRLKKKYSMFTKLIGHTGVNWNAATNTVVAPDQVWDSFRDKNKDVLTFKKQGCKHYDLLHGLYQSNCATGALRVASTDPPQPSEERRKRAADFLAQAPRRAGKEPQLQAEHLEGSGDSDDPMPVEITPPNEFTPSPLNTSHRAPSKRKACSHAMEECIEIFKSSYTSLSKKSVSSRKKIKPLEEGVKILNDMRAAGEIDANLYLVGLEYLERKDNVQLFIHMAPDLRAKLLELKSKK